MKRLKIGVVCEGPTDFHAISLFMEPALAAVGIEAVFIPIQPDMGRTLPEGGWGNVEAWLKNNPPLIRVRQHFDGGMFGIMSAQACDVLLIQMDSDILDDPRFKTRMGKVYGFGIPEENDSGRRGALIVQILELWSKLDELTKVDKRRHVFAPAVEATEAWCIAAYDVKHPEPEKLKGEPLAQAFMTALNGSEGRPPMEYSTIDKNVDRRRRFCETHNGGHARVVDRCPHFGRAVEAIATLAKQPR